MFTFETLQNEHREWVVRNFGLTRPDVDGKFYQPVFGAMEEMGELAHSFLKRDQGIRGSYEEHTEKAKDAIGDITVFLADICSAQGWNYQEIVEQTWNHVKQRDWTKNKLTGVAEATTDNSVGIFDEIGTPAEIDRFAKTFIESTSQVSYPDKYVNTLFGGPYG